jgi:hypothetical protein
MGFFFRAEDAEKDAEVAGVGAGLWGAAGGNEPAITPRMREGRWGRGIENGAGCIKIFYVIKSKGTP